MLTKAAIQAFMDKAHQELGLNEDDHLEIQLSKYGLTCLIHIHRAKTNEEMLTLAVKIDEVFGEKPCQADRCGDIISFLGTDNVKIFNKEVLNQPREERCRVIDGVIQLQ